MPKWKADALIEKKKKEKEKAGSKPKSQSSSVENRAKNSTFMGGGSPVRKTEKGPSEEKLQQIRNRRTSSTTSTPTARRTAATPQRMTDTGTGGRRSTTRTEARDYNNNLKQTMATESRRRTKATLDKVDDAARSLGDRAAKWEKENLSARNPMLEAQRTSQNRKIGQQAAERLSDRYGKQELSKGEKNFIDYTEGVVKRKALGYAKTASDLLSSQEGYKPAGRWAEENPEYAREITSKSFANRADKAFGDYAAKQESVQKNLTNIENNASKVGKTALQAYGSGLEMGIDRLAGPMWAASMFASAYGNQRGQAMKEGATDEQDARAAFFGAGVEVATEYMFKPVAGIASKFGGKHSLDFAGKLAAKVTSKLTGNKAKIADLAVRTLGSQIEEGLEEVAGWAVSPYINNAVYKSDLQRSKEEQAHADYNDMQQSFWNQFDSEEEAQQAALHVSSDEFINDLAETYESNGATKKEARRMAEIMQRYFLAHFDNDEKAAEEAEAEMDRFVVGDVRERHSWSELGQTLASTFLLTGVTGGASVYYTNQIGDQMLEGSSGKDRVKQYADIVIKYDPDNAKDAKAVKSTIDDGGTPTGTQAYQVATQATEVLQEMDKRQMASDQVKQRRMRDEDLQVSPVVMTARGPQFNEETGKAYQASYDKAVGVFRGLRKHGLDVGLSEETLTDQNAMRTAAHAVAAYETGTITAEQINDLTIDNPEIRTAFELATGVELSQYDVMRNGRVDETASNNAMMNGLLANAADNYVQMARAEQKQWSNRTRGRMINAMSKGLGDKGNLAMHDVLKETDPRNQQQYMLTARVAQNVYDYARRTDISWEKMKNAYKGSLRSVDVDSLKSVYDAAKEDKAKAETSYLGRTVSMGQPMRFEKGDNGAAMVTGEFSNDSNRELTGEEDEALRAVASRLGVNIRIVPDAELVANADTDSKMSADESSVHYNGTYDSSTNTIFLSETNSLDNDIRYAMSHETTHLLAQYAPEAYMKLSNYVMNKWYRNDPAAYERAIQAKQSLYKRVVNQDLSEEAALEEIIADATRDFWADPEFVNELVNEVEEPSLIKSFVNAIRDMLRHIRNLLSSGHFDGTEHEDVLWDMLGTYSQAERLWLNAYKEAMQNRAQMAIDEWQDNANNETRLSVAEDKWNNGEKLSKAKFNSFYSAHKLNYGASQKGDLTETISSIKENGFTSSTALSNVVPASINDYVNPEMPNYTQGLYGARAGDTVMLVPKPYLDQKNDTVKSGFKPRDYEIVTVERDFQPYYELYSKAYDEAHESRYSITPEQDTNYMAAVERGDMETAQRMVDDAAAEAMPNTKLKGRWYHGTENEFTEFNFSQGGKNGTADGFGIYLTNDPEVASSYGNRMIEGYVNVERPASALTKATLTKPELHRLIRRTVEIEAETLQYDGYDSLEDAKRDTWISNYVNTYSAKNLEDAIADVTDSILQFNGNDMDIIQEIMVGMGIRDYDSAMDFYDMLTEETGIDGFETKWGDESEMADPNTPTIALAFRSEQIKSADPVTYGDDGKVIPLSERFDPNNDDIRYSLPTQDSDGNILTDGQMEYFKNSQARDEQGRLVPVYHTTNKGGFTIFDPMRSDDHRSLFFASNWDVSQTYGSYANSRFYQFKINNLNDVEKYLDAYGPDFYVLTKDEFERAGGYEADFVDFENEGPQYRFDAIQKKWKSSNRSSETRTFLFKSYIEDVENGDIDPDDYVVIVGVPDYSPDNRSYSDTWILANSPNELVSELKNHFLAQQNTYSGASTVGTQHGYYQCYLNLENPLIIDAQGQSWNDISDPNAVKFWIRKLIGSDRKPNGLYGVMFDGPLGEYREGTPEELSDLYNGSISDLIDEYDISIGANSFTIDRNTGEQIYGESSGNTRYWAERAEAEGHDGVIFRNLLDIGGKSEFDGLDEYSDIYIAFSSNQVKDTQNQNPTENPDIRYSITDDDEAMSHMAHDYAYDNSYEALAYYESLIDTDTPTEVTFEEAQRYIDKDIDEFYAGLTRYADGMKFDDPVLEEGRVRMARSKQDYFNSNIAKWNEAWLTDGEVLDVKSVKKQVKDLVSAVMQESDTTRKYRTDLVNKAVIDMRLAYFYAKKGRTDVADALLWHSAHRMIDGVEFYADDSTYEEYKGLRDYLKTARIQLGEEYWSDADYGAFRKANFGRINLVQGSTNVDQIYAELEEIFPGLFDSEEYTTPPDQLMHIAEVLDSIQPYKEAYSSEQAAEFATDIASDLLEIMQNGKELQSVADKYKNRYEAKAKAMKARHAEAMLKVRQQKEKGIKAEKAKFKEYVEKQKEKKAHNKYFDSINRSYKKLTERLLTNTADKNIPEQYKKELAKVLAAFDLQTVGSKKSEARTGRQGKKSIKMANLKVTLENIENKSGEFHVSDAVTDIIDELLGKNVGNGSSRSIEGLTIDELNSSELARIDKLLKALIYEFNTYKTVKINTKRQQVKDIGNAQVKSALEHAKVFGSGQDYYGVHGWVDRILNMDELTPAYLFRRIDPNKEGMALMYEQLEDSHDRYIRNTVQLSEWIDEIVGEYHHKGLLKKDAGVLEQWRSENYAQNFKLENGHTITLTPAQMMSVYCLSKRAQAYNHMTGAGIVVAPVSYNAKILSDLKKKAKVALPEMLTDSDIRNIVSKLDPDQVKVADKLQNLMADKMAAWGNEASMNVLGIELFGEPDYFPIKSDKAGLISDLSEDQFVEAIRSFGFTKAVQPGARNAIMVEDIFDVIAQHCNNMNLYNAYSEAINDFMKVYNYRDVSEEGEYTVKQAIGHAYSQKATNFIMSFMKDLNGNVSNGRTTGINDAFNESLARAKKASVFANIRVAAQQPTAIGRAFAVISPKYASAMLKPDKAILDEMFEHCPIAKWKSLGYYDINMGRNIEDVIMNNNNVIEEAATWAYGALDNLTWGGIWQMVKAETEDKHPKVEKGSDDYWDLCNRRMREVVAFTQVVDSPFHRSHAMRSKNFMDKLATAFGAEPTLTYNMVRDGYIRAKEMVLTGDKVGATKVFGRTMSVFVFTAGLTAASAAFADVLRGKRPDGDDDDEQSLLQMWWANTLANWKDNVNLLNNIYYVKDIMSLLDGWQINNLAFQGWKYIGTGIQQLYGNPFARSKDPWWKNMMYGVGYLTGVPVKTVMTDFGAIFNKAKNKLGFETPILDAYLESLSEIAIEKDEPKAEGSMWSLIKENTVDKAAEKMGYKPIEQKAEADTEGKTQEPGREGFLARIGVGKTTEEKEQDAIDKKANDIAEKTADLEGEARDKKVWSYVTTYLKSQNGDKPLNEFIQEGDFNTVDEYRKMYVAAGGNTEYFDQRIFDTSKSAMKKTIVYDPTEEQIKAQDKIKGYLLTHGMDESELSEMVYKSDTAKDMKVAFRLNDKDLMLETLEPLVRAGLTYDDLERLWENRNRMQISSYKGRYKDKLKSTGNFIWPTDGQITSYFGYRNAPTAGASSNHPAIDIGAPMGAEVVAADGGVVIYAGTNGGYGNSVGIKHDNGMVTYYNHLSAWNVKVGDQVGQGQQIAQVGSTGISTGPHLDFKILDENGEPVDPEKYLSK